MSGLPGEHYPLRFPEAASGKLRRELLACKTIDAVLRLTWRLVLQAEQTSEGLPCDHCQLQRPAPPCVVAGDD